MGPLIWLVLSDEQMSKRWPVSLLNDEQMSNWVGVKHLPGTISGKSRLVNIIPFGAEYLGGMSYGFGT